jgi:hypothetical protein
MSPRTDQEEASGSWRFCESVNRGHLEEFQYIPDGVLVVSGDAWEATAKHAANARHLESVVSQSSLSGG